jgi:hypothetical protein
MTKLVRTPVPDWSGDVGNIHFERGMAKVADNAAELAYFRSAGYQIDDFDDALDAAPAENQPAIEDLDVQGGSPTDEDNEVPVVKDVDGDGTEEVLPRKNASAEEWRRFAEDHGFSKDEAAAMSRDELVEHFTKEEDQ